MKKLLALLLLLSMPAFAQSTAEYVVVGTQTITSTGPKFIPASTSAPLPISVFGGTSGQVYTSNGPGSAATFQPGGGGGSGTVNSGTQYQLGYYGTTGTAISGNSGILTDASNDLFVTTGMVGIGTTAPNAIVSLDGQAARTINMIRETTSSTAGKNLTLQAGGAATLGTNLAGGALNLSSGVSTGNAGSQINFNVYVPGTSGTADANSTTAMTVNTNAAISIGTTFNSSLGNLTVEAPNNLSGIVIDGTTSSGGHSSALYLSNNLGSNLNGLICGPASGTSSCSNIIGGNGLGVVARSGIMLISNQASGSIVLSTGSSSSNDTAKLTVLTSGNVGIGTSSPNATITVNGGYSSHRVTVSNAGYTILVTDQIVAYTTLSASQVVSVACTFGSTLNPQLFEITDESGGAGTLTTITVTPTSGTIDGSSSKVGINSSHGFYRFYSNGTNCFSS